MRRVAASLALSWLAGCAFDLVHVRQLPVELSQGTRATPLFVLQRAVDLDVGFGYRRVLQQGSTWSYVGSVPAGDVYRTRDQVLTVEASNIHEAYIVVKDARVVGYYLPVEKTYSPATTPAMLPMR